MQIYVDIDNTICRTSGSNYPESEPIMENIEKVNRLYDEGHTIIYWTARGGNSGIDWSVLTKQQLIKWGAKHHDLKLNKPSFDVFIDDKVINTKDWELGKWIDS